MGKLLKGLKLLLNELYIMNTLKIKELQLTMCSNTSNKAQEILNEINSIDFNHKTNREFKNFIKN